LIKLAG